jgi:cytidyltransferase-like protein
MRVIIVSGYFNPIHKGHLEYFEKSKNLGDQLWVIVNNDHQRELKGSKEFQKEDERLKIVQSIRTVDLAFLSIDKDRTVIESLKHLHSIFGVEHKMYFANGGDQNNLLIPESNICEELGIELIDGLGEKIQSSSWLLNKNI